MTAERPVADRPAAELLAEYDATEPGMWDRDHFRLLNTRDILVRLARAEQALDDLAKPHTPMWTGSATAAGGLSLASLFALSAPLSVPLGRPTVADRPAAELLVELDLVALPALLHWGIDIDAHRHVLERLVRAEQALAEVLDCGSERPYSFTVMPCQLKRDHTGQHYSRDHGRYWDSEPYDLPALRASQGGSS